MPPGPSVLDDGTVRERRETGHVWRERSRPTVAAAPGDGAGGGGCSVRGLQLHRTPALDRRHAARALSPRIHPRAGQPVHRRCSDALFAPRSSRAGRRDAVSGPACRGPLRLVVSDRNRPPRRPGLCRRAPGRRRPARRGAGRPARGHGRAAPRCRVCVDSRAGALRDHRPVLGAGPHAPLRLRHDQPQHEQPAPLAAHGWSTRALRRVLRARGEPPAAGLVPPGRLRVGVAFLARPSNAILLAPVLLLVLFREPGARARVVLGVLPAVLFEVAYRWSYFNNPFYTQVGDIGARAWTNHWLGPFAGLLVSPGRGLFVYTPAFVLSIVGFSSRGVPGWLRAVGVGSLLTVVTYAHWGMWWGGWSVGPRLLADLSPGLVLGLAPLRGTLLRASAVVLGALSIAAHALMAFTVSGYAWNAWAGTDASRRVWQWHH